MTLRSFLDEAAASHPKAVALRYCREGTWRQRTYQEMLLDVRQIAEACGALGLTPGKEQVAIILENGPEWIELYLATAGAGLSVTMEGDYSQVTAAVNQIKEDLGTATWTALAGICLILTIYFVASLSSIKRGVYQLVPASKRAKFIDISEQVSHAVGRYVIGQGSLAHETAEGGTGLGLSTVYGLVRQNRGLVTVYSEPGEGTLFRIYLPRVDTAEGATEAAAQVDVEVLRGDETLLVVEDAENLRDLIAAILESFGYSVYTAREGKEALTLEEQHRDEIDLVITDVVMPEMSGTELADELIERSPELRILFISGYPNDRAISAGHHDPRFSFLQKPFSASELTSAVRALLDG